MLLSPTFCSCRKRGTNHGLGLEPVLNYEATLPTVAQSVYVCNKNKSHFNLNSFFMVVSEASEYGSLMGK